MIAQLEAFLDQPSFNDKQSKRLRKAAKQLRKMGGPKTGIDAATWRNIHDEARDMRLLHEAGKALTE